MSGDKARAIPDALEFRRARDGGYMILQSWSSAGDVREPLFAGSLAACLAYLQQAFEPQMTVGFGPALMPRFPPEKAASGSVDYEIRGDAGVREPVDLGAMMQDATRSSAPTIDEIVRVTRAAFPSVRKWARYDEPVLAEDARRETEEQLTAAVQEDLTDAAPLSEAEIGDLWRIVNQTADCGGLLRIDRRAARYLHRRLVEVIRGRDQTWSERLWAVLAKAHQSKVTSVGVGAVFGKVTAIATPDEYVFFGDGALEEATHWLEANLKKVKEAK